MCVKNNAAVLKCCQEEFPKFLSFLFVWFFFFWFKPVFSFAPLAKCQYIKHQLHLPGRQHRQLSFARSLSRKAQPTVRC